MLKKKVTYQTFLRQILYLNKNKGKNARQIRKIFKLSYSKRVIPSRKVGEISVQKPKINNNFCQYFFN
jgi:hypothetical protein